MATLTIEWRTLMKNPKVIFLDAVGTLFGVRGSVGEVYSAIARESGVTVEPKLVDRAFYQSFKASPPLAFAEVDRLKISELEFQWWQAIAKDTFVRAEVFAQFEDFDTFFGRLYDYFATSDPWFIYPDVLPTLTRWQRQGIELGIVSNFDSRIYAVLEHLQLRQFFTSITISSEVGAAKPDRQIFTLALAKHACYPQQTWHIGDSKQEDYLGAIAAGLNAFLIERF